MFAGALTYSGGFFEFNLKGDDIMDGDASHKHIDLIDKSEVDNGNWPYFNREVGYGKRKSIC